MKIGNMYAKPCTMSTRCVWRRGDTMTIVCQLGANFAANDDAADDDGDDDGDDDDGW